MIRKMPLNGRRCSVLLLLSASVFLPSVALGSDEADEPGPEPKVSSIIVLDVRASGPIDVDQVAGISTIVTTEVAKHEVLEVLSSGDVREMLGFEAQRQLLDCVDDDCLSEIGDVLGVDYLLTSEVFKFGSSWLFTLALLDMRDTETMGRVTVRTRSEDELLDELDSAVRRVLASLLGDEDDRVGRRSPAASGAPRSRVRPELAIRAGMSGHAGVLGLAAELRPLPWLGLAVGSGTHMLGGGLSLGGAPWRGLYLDLHGVWLRGGPITGRGVDEGFGSGATIGFELRPSSRLSVKAGMGGAWNFATGRPGLTLDLMVGPVF